MTTLEAMNTLSSMPDISPMNIEKCIDAIQQLIGSGSNWELQGGFETLAFNLIHDGLVDFDITDISVHRLMNNREVI